MPATTENQKHEQAHPGDTLPRLVNIMQTLLGKNGCPWDRAQTPKSLRRYILEEACEVIDAIDQNNPDELKEELGDLLLQVVFQSEIAHIGGQFSIDDVVNAICDKLERRHPHVFGNSRPGIPGDTGPETVGELHENWEAIKSKEQQRTSVIEGIPLSLPALARSQKLSEKAASVGFDWPDWTGCRAKVAEEIAELDEAISKNNPNAINHEIGDALFSIANLARHWGVDPELALRQANNRFASRFEDVERQVIANHGGFHTSHAPVDLDTLENYWQEAKRRETT
ncbi:MAG: nucleoside triphosphate pyrophosphohydrolase [Polyangiaceae bacterium]|nr:nucleoside triphosphate pyrophosphohydrolase [Polyangiaceae bacterium]